MSFAIDIAEELTIPVITFRTFSACCTWTYFHLTKLIEEGEVPFQGMSNLFIPPNYCSDLSNLNYNPVGSIIDLSTSNN
jgi:hypothetical protein